MIDHMSFSVSDFDRAKTFYLKCLAPLGLRIFREAHPDSVPDAFGYVCFGTDHPCFCINTGGTVLPSLHVAFTAKNRTDVDEFFKAALNAGGTENGSPGLRTQYHANYYSAFVRDPDGHNIEAVSHHSD